MRRLLNTLYVFTEDAYLSLDGENVAVKQGKAELGRVPLHTLEGIVCFSRSGASPYLMGACSEKGIGISFFTPNGKYLAGIHSEHSGNVLLRKEQYRISEDPELSLAMSRNFILGKLFNSRWVLERALRDHGIRIDVEGLKESSGRIAASMLRVKTCVSMESLRGIEGDAAAEYYKFFDELILRDKEYFGFNGRVRRPSVDPTNAMLSLFYTVLANDCASALQGVGLDPYVGFMHVDRPGRKSFALDLMEELRPLMSDRFVLSSINNRVINSGHFEVRETGEVRVTDPGRRILFKSWQDKKREIITHPFLKEKIPWGLVPHVQALLLMRCIRGDLDQYPPLLWK